jgi:hypothetical protein
VLNESAGFVFDLGYTLHERVGFYETVIFDVCYCLKDCASPRQWFKTGEVRLNPIHLVSSATNLSIDPAELSLQYVNQPGTIGFYRPPNMSNQLGMEDGGMLKLLEDEDLSANDADCLQQPWSTNVSNTSMATGLSENTAATVFAGVTHPEDPFKMVFNAGNLDNQITVQRVGLLAVCYCPKSDGQLCYRDQWKLAGHLTIKGPNPNQYFRVTTYTAFRIEIDGYGFSENDKVRFIPSTSRCSENENNPNGETPLTGLRMQCPYPCVDIGTANQPINGDFEVNLLADDRYNCDTMNTNCESNDIVLVTVLNSTHTQLRFQFPPGLLDGDMITLGDNIECDPESTYCNNDMLTVIKGLYNFADARDNTPLAPDYYIVGNKVTMLREEPGTTYFNRNYLINVGWPDPKPLFKVIPDENNNFKKGIWVRHNKAKTREEIMGLEQKPDMKICWKYGESHGSYVAQIGTLTIKDASMMTGTTIRMTSTIKRMALPIIVAFSTGYEPRYAEVQGMTKLRIVFTDINYMDAYYTTALPIRADSSADEFGEAMQLVCGNLFKEIWSSASDWGVQPKGCYHTAWGISREINIVFETKNGLQAGTDYQLVMYARTEEGVQQYGEYVEINAMDDAFERPYEMIQRGIAPLDSLPEAEAAGAKGVMFLKPNGFFMTGGDDAGLFQLNHGRSLNYELRGEPTGGGIRASSILRIFLWPLTMWHVNEQCVAECNPYYDINFDQAYNEANFYCGPVRACLGKSVVPGQHRNILYLEMPSTMNTASEFVPQMLRVTDVVFPAGGIFPLRFSAQITKSDDTRPDYVEGSGNLVYKAPAAGQTWARLVNVYGDGDHAPFRGDQKNVLYAQVVLGATLFAAVQTGDSSIVLTLPEGYECLREQDFTDYDWAGNAVRTNVWMAEDTLKVFGTTIPQGRGTPDATGTGTRGWSVYMNNCTFTLSQMTALYQGVSLYIRVTVNNPPNSLKSEDPANKWYVTLKGKGLHDFMVDFPSVLFHGSATQTLSDYAANSAVLGRMDSASIVPWNFAYMQSTFHLPNEAYHYKDSSSELYIFFQTEQFNRVLGFVQIAGPDGYDFTTGYGLLRDGTLGYSCTANDLPDVYYAKRFVDLSYDTHRLPGIVNCKVRTNDPVRAEVKLEGMLRTQFWYGFSLSVRNRVTYKAEHHDQWKLFTVTEAGFRVDGTPIPVKLETIPQSLRYGDRYSSDMDMTKSFGAYEYSLEGVAVLLETLRPWYITRGRSKVTLRSIQLNHPIHTLLRVIAPAGYVWDFADGEFFPGPFLCVDGVMPSVANGSVPIRVDNFLIFQNASYDARPKTYGFEAFVQVPPQSPTSSINAFIIQFGFNSTNATERTAAATVQPQRDPGPNHVDIEPDYVVFQLDLPDVPEGGELRFESHWNPFVFDSATFPDCTSLMELFPYRAPPAKGCQRPILTSLPRHVTCDATGSSAAFFRMRIIMGPGGLPYGLYRFRMKLSSTWELPSIGGSVLPPSVLPPRSATSRRLSASNGIFFKVSSGCFLNHCFYLYVSDNNGNDLAPVTALQGPTSVVDELASASEVGALSDADADYSNNVVQQMNNLTLTIRTVSDIPPGGGIHITGPESFGVEPECTVLEPTAPRNNAYTDWSTNATRRMLPDDVVCTSTFMVGYIGEEGSVDGTTTIIIKAGAQGIRNGLYRWQINANNTPVEQQNPPAFGTLCGSRWCWTFKTIEDLSQPEANWVLLDVPTTTTSFAVNNLIQQAHIANVTWPQRMTTGRDDRPFHYNPIVFAFMIYWPAVFGATFKIRAPLGYVFREECLQDIETQDVFGTGSLPEFAEGLGQPYHQWDPDIKITYCRGDGPDAEFYVDPGDTPGLPANKLIPFRMAVINPEFFPIDNTWTLDFAGESCVPFEGFPVWTFRRTDKHGVSWATNQNKNALQWMAIPVSMTYRPENTVGGRGMQIKVTAPPSYRFVHDRLECNFSVQRLDSEHPEGHESPPFNFTDISSLLSPEYVRWGESEIYCVVNETDLTKLTATVTVDDRELLGGVDYQLTVFVNNPTGFPPWSPKGWGVDQAYQYPWTLTPMYWLVETEAGPHDNEPYFRDLCWYPSSPIIQRLAAWSVTNYNDFTETSNHDAKSIVYDVVFTVMLDSSVSLSDEDSIFIEAPFGTNLSADPTEPSFEEAISPRPQSLLDPDMDFANGECNNFRWAGISQEWKTRTNVTCGSRFMRIKIRSAFFFEYTVPQMTFFLNVMNGAKTPHASLNNWICRHQDQYNVTKAEEAIGSWPLKSQLEQVDIKLTGMEVRASLNQEEITISSIYVYLTPVSDASELELEAIRPAKWDFTGAYATSLGHTVVPEVRAACREPIPPELIGACDLQKRKVRIQCTLFAGLPAIIKLQGVGLAWWGGPTLFNLLTKLVSGTEKDRKDGFAGFQMPGNMKASSLLQNMYQKEPDVYPVAASFKTRMNEFADASFTFSFTQDAFPGMSFRVSAVPYELYNCSLEYCWANRSCYANLRAPEYSWANGEVTMRLNDSMPYVGFGTFAVYRLSCTVFTPAVATSTDATWRFDVLDDNIDNLPHITNDGVTSGFPLAAPIDFTVVSARSPPFGEIQVEVMVDPKSIAPTELVMVMPLNWNVSEGNCLASGGSAGQVTGCSRTADVAGRQAARLSLKSPGLFGPVSDVLVKVVVPAVPQEETTFYMQAKDSKWDTELGWGFAPKGIEVTPMPSVIAIYSSIPQVQSKMIFTFESTIRVDPGGSLRVYYPVGMKIFCSEEPVTLADEREPPDNFNRMSLRGEPTCRSYGDNDISMCEQTKSKTYDPNNEKCMDPFMFQIELPEVLPPGLHSFEVTSELPREYVAPQFGNLFVFLVRDPTDNVADALATVPAIMPLDDLYRPKTIREEPMFNITSVPLMFDGSEALTSVMISLGFYLGKDLPSADAEIQLVFSSILIKVPTNFKHQILGTGSMRYLSPWPLPWESPKDLDASLDISDPTYFRIRFNEFAARPQFRKGEYRFEFPVLLPSVMPPVNVWTMTICGPTYGVNGSTVCNDHLSPGALTTFPWKGFEMNAMPSGVLGLADGSLRSGISGAAIAVCLIGIFRVR